MVQYAQGPPTPFRRGDGDGNGSVALEDVVHCLPYLFEDGEPPACFDAVDVNDDGVVNISDPIWSLMFQFRGGSEIPSPGSATCGVDPTVDALTCESFPACE